MLKEEIRGISSDNAVSDNVFDIVLCSMMLMDCEDFEGTVKEIVRVPYTPFDRHIERVV